MMSDRKPFSRDILVIKDVNAEIDRITEWIRENVIVKMKRRGGIVGISGGIDSSVTLALSVRAFGPGKVIGIMLPEKESSPESERMARVLSETFGVECRLENISGALQGFRCYERRDEAVKRVFDEFDPSTYKSKIGINRSGLDQNLPPVFSLTVVAPDGSEQRKMLPVNEYLQIVAASNFKQRSRMTMLYYHAETNHFAVMGTPNKHEVEQGFFVKFGDGGADIFPIAHLYKTQVYQLAEALGVPAEIIARTPTTDTYSAEQTQEEFFFQMPFREMDLYWYGFENGYPAEEVAGVMGNTEEDVKRIYSNFLRKQRTTEYLRSAPIRMDE